MEEIFDELAAETPHKASLAQLLVAQAYDVDVNAMCSARRSDARTALARQIAMYLSHIVLKMSFAQIGAAFGRERSTACHALHHVENMRDDPELDRTLLQLEVMLRETVGDAA
jgi:chromosomal replication initiation ATPase DnaA